METLLWHPLGMRRSQNCRSSAMTLHTGGLEMSVCVREREGNGESERERERERKRERERERERDCV